jgi:hypothetical protein
MVDVAFDFKTHLFSVPRASVVDFAFDFPASAPSFAFFCEQAIPCHPDRSRRFGSGVEGPAFIREICGCFST